MLTLLFYNPLRVKALRGIFVPISIDRHPMYHIEGGRKYIGEKFDMYKAKEVCERYRGLIPTSVTVCDVYVAINSQYHDYVELFKDWFGDGIEQKIVESAIVFWFKDADCKAENKVVEYLGEY